MAAWINSLAERRTHDDAARVHHAITHPTDAAGAWARGSDPAGRARRHGTGSRPRPRRGRPPRLCTSHGSMARCLMARVPATTVRKFVADLAAHGKMRRLRPGAARRTTGRNRATSPLTHRPHLRDSGSLPNWGGERRSWVTACRVNPRARRAHAQNDRGRRLRRASPRRGSNRAPANRAARCESDYERTESAGKCSAPRIGAS